MSGPLSVGETLEKLTARNLELCIIRDRLLAAVKNHSINCQVVTSVDRELWEKVKAIELNKHC